MIFGPTPLEGAEGAILAHSLSVAGRRLKKGLRLTAEDVALLAGAGLKSVVTARPGPQDVAEDEAATRIGAALAPAPGALGLSVAAAFTGRLNLYAAAGGVLKVSADLVAAVNGVHPAVTLATLPDHARVAARQMVGTVKIIPYSAPKAAVAQVEALLTGGQALRVHPFRHLSADLILTATPGMKDSLLTKGARALRDRLAALDCSVAGELRVAHETEALAAALERAEGDMTLILAASATSDIADVGPSALIASGGMLTRFGMPVDPGNLMFLGRLKGRDVIGMPGCARSLALNGVDWVLERLVAGLAVTDADIAAMGVGGLLKEIASRPQPRGGGARAPARPKVAVVVLAAGASSRMRGRDKLLEPVAGEPLLARVAGAAMASDAGDVVVVLRPGAEARRAVLSGIGVRMVENRRAEEGMAASIRCGLAEAPGDADAVVLMLADMPEVTANHINRLIAAYSPEDGRAIARAMDANGQPGHPVLIGRRFFESLALLDGDRGAAHVLKAHEDFVTLVATEGRGATLDLDTPEAWAAFRAEASG